MTDSTPLPDTQGSDSTPPETSQQFPYEIDFFKQLQAHDTEAWDLIFSIYAPKLRRDIIQSLNKRNLPLEWLDDVEQTTWITVVRRIDAFIWENETNFYHWFRSIATFHTRNLERKLRNTYISLEDIDEDVDTSGFSLDFFLYLHGLIEDSPEAHLALQESMELLDRAMQNLTTRDREILLKRVLYDESVQQLAKDYGVKPESVSVILVRTKQAIRERVAYLKARDNIQD